MNKLFVVTILSLSLGLMPSFVGAEQLNTGQPSKNQTVATAKYQKVGYQTVRYRAGGHYHRAGGHYGHRWNHRYYRHGYYYPGVVRYYTPYRQWVKKCYIRYHRTYCYRVRAW